MKAEYVDHMGTDLTVINAARVSFGKDGEAKLIGEREKSLLLFLARGMQSKDWEKMASKFMIAASFDEIFSLMWDLKNTATHWAPFSHPKVMLRLDVPIFVARQFDKHQVGFETSELSRRYVDEAPDFFFPEKWRARASDVKQGSGDEVVTEYAQDGYLVNPDRMANSITEFVRATYLSMVRTIAPEQVRMLLPQSMYTSYIKTGSLLGWARLYNQRTDPHAQREIQELAQQIGEIIEPMFPYSWAALTKGQAPT